MKLPWYQDALDNLKISLEESTSNRVNGHQFLIEYFTEESNNHYLDLGIDYSEEELENRLDEFVGEEVDKFENWIKSNHSNQFEIKSRYNWLKRTDNKITPHVEKQEAQPLLELSNEESILLDTAIANLNTELTKEITTLLRQKLLNSDNDDLIYKAQLRIAWGRDKDVDISITDKAKAWEELAHLTKTLNKSDSYKWYIKAAEYRNRHLEHDRSAEHYKEAFELAEKQQITQGKLLKIIRNCRKQYEAAGDERSASNIFVLESDKLRASSKGLKKFGLGVYKCLSKYGEGPHYVAGWCLFVILTCACLYSWVGITPTYANNIDLSTLAQTDKQDLNPLTYMYYSVVTFTTLGYGDFRPPEGWARIISGVEAMLGLILTSLLLVTIVRKFSRN